MRRYLCGRVGPEGVRRLTVLRASLGPERPTASARAAVGVALGVLVGQAARARRRVGVGQVLAGVRPRARGRLLLCARGALIPAALDLGVLVLRLLVHGASSRPGWWSRRETRKARPAIHAGARPVAAAAVFGRRKVGLWRVRRCGRPSARRARRSGVPAASSCRRRSGAPAPRSAPRREGSPWRKPRSRS